MKVLAVIILVVAIYTIETIRRSPESKDPNPENDVVSKFGLLLLEIYTAGMIMAILLFERNI